MTKQLLKKQKYKKNFLLTFAKKYQVLIDHDSSQLPTVLHVHSLNTQLLSEIERFLACPFSLKLITQDMFDQKLIKQYESDPHATSQMLDEISDTMDLTAASKSLGSSEDLLSSHDDAPVIKLVNALLSQGIKEKASDIHIESFEETVIIRFRIDGILYKILEPSKLLAPLLLSRIKVMAKLDISEKRMPQDGRIALTMGEKKIDVRVSTIPSNHGERIVLRLLIKNKDPKPLSELGLSVKEEATLCKILNSSHGILLVTGPTGAGKSTTLYSSLSTLNTSSKNILTIEDPIEYDIKGVGQTQVHNKIGMTFAKGLRAILRQDPDIIMIGEIRDKETAQIAVQASLTGHLVLSTLHTNTAIGAITRLEDMGIEKFLLSSSLLGLVAQRLVRLLCDHCKEKITLSDADRRKFKLTSQSYTVYKATGCKECNETGYKGRQAIYEVIMCNQNLKNLIHEGASENKIEEYVRQNYESIQQNGLQLVLSGQTSLEEILRVTLND